MPQSATASYRFAETAPRLLVASFDGGRLTLDGGLPWLAGAEQTLGPGAAVAAAIPECRRGPVRDSRETLVRQRVFQIACSDEDQDNADTLHTDPLLSRRVPDRATLVAESASWQERRNANAGPIDWRFTIAGARIKLKRL